RRWPPPRTPPTATTPPGVQARARPRRGSAPPLEPLALDALRRPRQRLEAVGRDGLTAPLAIAVRTAVDPAQRRVDRLQQMVSMIADRERHLAVERLAGAVGHVAVVAVLVDGVLHRPGRVVDQVLASLEHACALRLESAARSFDVDNGHSPTSGNQDPQPRGQYTEAVWAPCALGSVAAGVVAGLDGRHELGVLALLLTPPGGVRQALLVVANGLEGGAEQGPQPQPELRLLRQEPRGLAADALARGVRAVHQVAGLGLGVPDDQLRLPRGGRPPLVRGD